MPSHPFGVVVAEEAIFLVVLPRLFAAVTDTHNAPNNTHADHWYFLYLRGCLHRGTH